MSEEFSNTADTHLPLCEACAERTHAVFYLSGRFVVRCHACGLYILGASEAVTGAESMLDRTRVEPALHSLRLANYERIVRRLREFTPLAGRRLLDVGCSTGWFLEMADRHGCRCYGIEPDGYFYDRLDGRFPACGRMAKGYFPDDLPSDWGLFDIITFNDVFEHLPDPLSVLQTCRRYLTSDGCVVLALPVADGFVFRLSWLLYEVGIRAPLERMFQINYPYPHLYYFTRRSIVLLSRRAGFDSLLLARLRSFSLRGAVDRAWMDRTLDYVNIAKRSLAAVALGTFAVVESLLPADNVVVILRPTGRAAPAAAG